MASATLLACRGRETAPACRGPCTQIKVKPPSRSWPAAGAYSQPAVARIYINCAARRNLKDLVEIGIADVRVARGIHRNEPRYHQPRIDRRSARAKLCTPVARESGDVIELGRGKGRPGEQRRQ